MDTSTAGMILILLLALFGILLFLSIEYKKNKDYRYLLSSVIVAEFMALFLACLIYAMFAHKTEILNAMRNAYPLRFGTVATQRS